jgi:hypothetical protein
LADRVIKVCDIDGAPATHTVRIQDGQAGWVKDLCDVHFRELLKGARKPTRGRRAGSENAASSARAGKSVAKRRATSGRGKRGTPRKLTSFTLKSTRRGRSVDVASEVRKLRDQGLSYKAIGDRLIERGVKPQRAARWNPIVLGRMAKRAAA